MFPSMCPPLDDAVSMITMSALPLAFTINSIHMKSLPSWEIPNGYSVTLECLVDISTTSKVRSHHQVLFYKDEMLLFNISSTEYTESIFIPQARVFHSGRYKCTVVLNSKEKTTQEYQLLVKGESWGLYMAKHEQYPRRSSHTGLSVHLSSPFPLTTWHSPNLKT